MYLRHFQLERIPFERGIASSSLYPSAQFSEALARLQYACQQRSIAVLTGEVGSGKSTALRKVADELDSNHYLFVYIADSQLTPRNFYSLALERLGVPCPSQLPKMKRAFQEVVADFFHTKEKTCVLAIDEAQFLEIDMIQEVRFIMNHRMDSYSPITLILAGQTEFHSVMRTLPMAAIRRRVDTFYHLGGMSAKETSKYIAHQMAVAGAKHPLFPDDVVERIHEHSKGLAAHINALCKGCLLDAAAREQNLIDSSNLKRVASEFS